MARVSGSEGWKVKVWKMSRITDVSQYPSFHPSVAYGDSSVGNAVLGVPTGAMRQHRARNMYRTAAFGGRNAGDGVPYGCLR